MSTSITLTWTEIAESDRSGVINSYVIRYREGTTEQTRSTQSNALTFTLTGLNPFSNYTFAVAGMNNASRGPFSADSGIITTAEAGKRPVIKLNTCQLYSLPLVNFKILKYICIYIYIFCRTLHFLLGSPNN